MRREGSRDASQRQPKPGAPEPLRGSVAGEDRLLLPVEQLHEARDEGGAGAAAGGADRRRARRRRRDVGKHRGLGDRLACSVEGFGLGFRFRF